MMNCGANIKCQTVWICTPLNASFMVNLHDRWSQKSEEDSQALCNGFLMALIAKTHVAKAIWGRLKVSLPSSPPLQPSWSQTLSVCPNPLFSFTLKFLCLKFRRSQSCWYGLAALLWVLRTLERPGTPRATSVCRAAEFCSVLFKFFLKKGKPGGSPNPLKCCFFPLLLLWSIHRPIW